MKTIMYIVAMAILCILPSCLKNNPASPANSGRFPTAKGDYWVYKVTNYQKNTVDTVTVSVVGSLKDPLQPGNFTILQRKWPDKMDSLYISVVNDTLTFYKRTSSTPPQFGYLMTNFIIYPLSLGKDFSISLQNFYYDSDTVREVSLNKVSVSLNSSLQNFTAYHEEKVFILNRMTQMSQYLIFDDDFVPGIGIIKETKTYRGGESLVMDTWELLYCHINNPPSSSQ